MSGPGLSKLSHMAIVSPDDYPQFGKVADVRSVLRVRLRKQGRTLLKRTRDAFKLGALSRSALSAELNMLITRGKARVLAEPKLVAAST